MEKWLYIVRKGGGCRNDGMVMVNMGRRKYRENGSQLGSSFAGRDDGVWLCAEEGSMTSQSGSAHQTRLADNTGNNMLGPSLLYAN